MSALQSFAASMMDVFTAIVRHSAEGAVVAVLVGFVLLLLGKRVAARWRYLLWMLVVVRLAVPVTVRSPLSVHNLVPEATNPASVLSVARPQAPTLTGMTLSPAEVNELIEAGVLDVAAAGGTAPGTAPPASSKPTPLPASAASPQAAPVRL